MCFELYIGAQVPIPDIEREPGISTTDAFDARIHSVIDLPYVKSLGSDMGCGCGFRYAYWDEEDVINKEENPELFASYASWFEGEKGIFVKDMGGAYVGEEGNVNQHQLADLLHSLLRDSDYVQLYGCWEGALAEPVAKRVEITAEQVRAHDFAFYPHSLYTVRAR